MALTSWNDILNKPKAVADVEELALTVEQLSASVLSINEDLGELELSVSDLSATVLSISEDVGELALDVSQLSASVLSINNKIENIEELSNTTFTAGSNITIGSRNAIYKNNRLAYISLVLTTTSAVNHDSVIASINSQSNIRFLEGQYLMGEVDGADLNNTVYMMTTTPTELISTEDLPSGTIIRVGAILPVYTV